LREFSLLGKNDFHESPHPIALRAEWHRRSAISPRLQEEMKTDLNSLVIFAQVAESKSFVKAARHLQMPTSTVSRRIAELESQLGVRLIERSTRSLRLTEVGTEILEHAQRSADVSEAVSNIASNHTTNVSGNLRLAAPPTISDSLLAPLICHFQELYPDVQIQVCIAERVLDPIAEGIDVAFRVGELEDSSLVVRRLLTYRHQLVASPAYLKGRKLPKRPQELLGHRLLAFSFWGPQNTWKFTRSDGKETESITFHPYLSINEYSGLAVALLKGVGIGEIAPIVQPALLREGRLVEVMPKWHFPLFNLSLVHLGNRYIPRPVRVFKDFAAEMVPKMFPELPT
jgi:DNA-binding transcriptional LysR family regulator